MRTILFCVLFACGGQTTPPDSGSGGGAGGGGSGDPPAINCDAGVTFCVGAVAWACAYSGHDAIFVSDCPLSDLNGPTGEHGACSESPCAGVTSNRINYDYATNPDGGAALKVGGIYCCSP